MNPTPTETSTRRILIVDDEAQILHVLKRIFRKLRPDYQIVTTDDGVTAWQQYQQGTYALILTDYAMPGMNGLELAGRIHRLKHNSHIVIMTGKCSDTLPNKLHELALAGFLPKPFSMTDIQTLLLKLGL